MEATTITLGNGKADLMKRVKKKKKINDRKEGEQTANPLFLRVS